MAKSRQPKSSKTGDRSHLTRRMTKIHYQDGTEGEGIRLFNDNPKDAGKSKILQSVTASLADTPEEQEPLKESLFALMHSIGMSEPKGETPHDQALSLLAQTGCEVNIHTNMENDMLPAGVHTYDGKAFNFVLREEYAETTPESEAVHELAHYLVADPARRDKVNFDYNFGAITEDVDWSELKNRESRDRAITQDEARHEEELASALGIALEYAYDFEWGTTTAVHGWTPEPGCTEHTPRDVRGDSPEEDTDEAWDDWLNNHAKNFPIHCPTCFPKLNQRLDEAMARVQKWGLSKR